MHKAALSSRQTLIVETKLQRPQSYLTIMIARLALPTKSLRRRGKVRSEISCLVPLDRPPCALHTTLVAHHNVRSPLLKGASNTFFFD